jgi:hypothetical protein
MYYYCECDVEGVLKCKMHLHIIEHPINTEFKGQMHPNNRKRIKWHMSHCSTIGSHEHLSGV